MRYQPIPLFPAFRSGPNTPWGGDKLKTCFGKQIPDPRTGESLEMSVIPGLHSVDAEGHPLESLLDQDWAGMAGTKVEKPFPLLLKLIDAQDRLSVQVHPDDDYARREENKLGKTEAWAILQAEPGAQLVYGIKEGVTKAELSAAAQDGEAIEKLLRFVPVKPGDVFYIPAGTVHAIGAGILLYEIQQSSDVTYRFYDWNRRDKDGKLRPLHIRQALDVTRVDYQPEAIVPETVDDPHCRREILLDTAYFGLERLKNCRDVPFTGSITHFSVLTLLTEGKLYLSDTNEALSLSAGQTVFIPADCAPVTLTCGECLIASPAHK